MYQTYQMYQVKRSLNPALMKRAINTTTAFGFVLALGLGVGIAGQKYLNVSDRIGALTKKIGIYKYFAAPTVASGAPLAASMIPEQAQGQLALYVLIGQSNMVGQSAVPAGFTPPENTYTFGNDYQWHKADFPVDSAQGQVDEVSLDQLAGFGPALPFAQALATADPKQAVGLISCAKSGSAIAQWGRSLSDRTLYGSCLKRVRAASTMGTVSGILFFQGEADAIDPEQFPAIAPAADTWAEQFATFAYNFRQDIGSPNAPLVYAQLGQPADLEGLSNWAAIQQQQESIQIPNAKMIKTSDLPMIGIHFTADSYIEIGNRYAAAMKTIGKAANSSETTSVSPAIDSVPVTDAGTTDTEQ